MFIRTLVLIKKIVLIICSLAVVLMVVAAFFARYFFSYDLYGIEEFLMVAAFWLYFMGAAYGSYEKSHIEANFVQSIFGDTPVTRAVGHLRDVIELGVLVVLTYWSWLLITFAYVRSSVTPGWRIPLLVPQSAILVGFILMTLFASIHYWRKLAGKPPLIERTGE